MMIIIILKRIVMVLRIIIIKGTRTKYFVRFKYSLILLWVFQLARVFTSWLMGGMTTKSDLRLRWLDFNKCAFEMCYMLIKKHRTNWMLVSILEFFKYSRGHNIQSITKSIKWEFRRWKGWLFRGKSIKQWYTYIFPLELSIRSDR